MMLRSYRRRRIAQIYYERLVLMWCFAFISRLVEPIQNLDRLLEEVSRSTDPTKIFKDIFVLHTKKIKDHTGKNIDVSSIRLNEEIGIVHDEFEGTTYSIHEGYRLFKRYSTSPSELVIIFPIYCFALANIFFNPSDEIKEYSHTYVGYVRDGFSFTNPLCYNHKNSIYQMGITEDDTPSSVGNCLTFKNIFIQQRPEFENLPKSLQEQINIFREEVELKRLEVAQSSCMRRVITGALCFLAVVALSVMFATIFPNAFAFINFPHLINNAFLGCVISTGIIGGLSLIFSITRIICAIFFHEAIWNKATETDSSKSARFLCKVLGGYPKAEKQIDSYKTFTK